MVKIDPHRIIWRDDDISVDTDMETFMRVDALFKKYGFRHTVALICKDLSGDIVEYIRDNPHIDPQIHCWEHERLTDFGVIGSLIRCQEKIVQLFGVEPKVVYPPWNITSPRLEMAASTLGLTVSVEKLSLPQYTRVNGHVKETTVNFHYWEKRDEKLLDKALQIYHKSGWNSCGDIPALDY